MKTSDYVADPDTPLHQRVTALSAGLSVSERRVAEFMANHPEVVVSCSAIELGARTGTSDATVVRTTKALGYRGLRELKRSLLRVFTRQRDLAATMDGRLERVAGDQLVGVIDDSVDLLGHLRDTVDPAAWRRAVDALRAANSVMVYGIGPAACVAGYLSLSLTRIGLAAREVTTTGFRLADELTTLRAGDVVVVFAPLREFREISVLVDYAGEVGASVVLVTESLGMSLESRVHAVLSTPQSTTGAASEVTAALVLAHALTMTLAAATRDNAVQALELVNQLRAAIVGTELDMATLPPPD
ncbi:MurR/RpiR family transcriptional regulator [Actinophytocola sediminis]